MAGSEGGAGESATAGKAAAPRGAGTAWAGAAGPQGAAAAGRGGVAARARVPAQAAGRAPALEAAAVTGGGAARAAARGGRRAATTGPQGTEVAARGSAGPGDTEPDGAGAGTTSGGPKQAAGMERAGVASRGGPQGDGDWGACPKGTGGREDGPAPPAGSVGQAPRRQAGSTHSGVAAGAAGASWASDRDARRATGDVSAPGGVEGTWLVSGRGNMDGGALAEKRTGLVAGQEAPVPAARACARSPPVGASPEVAAACGSVRTGRWGAAGQRGAGWAGAQTPHEGRGAAHGPAGSAPPAGLSATATAVRPEKPPADSSGQHGDPVRAAGVGVCAGGEREGGDCQEAAGGPRDRAAEAAADATGQPAGEAEAGPPAQAPKMAPAPPERAGRGRGRASGAREGGARSLPAPAASPLGAAATGKEAGAVMEAGGAGRAPRPP